MSWWPPKLLLCSLCYFCHRVPTGTFRDIFIWHSKRQNPCFINLLITKDFFLPGLCGSSLREQFLRAAPSKLASVTKAQTPEVPQNKTSEPRRSRVLIHGQAPFVSKSVWPRSLVRGARKARNENEDEGPAGRRRSCFYPGLRARSPLGIWEKTVGAISGSGNSGRASRTTVRLVAISQSPVSSQRQDPCTSFRLVEPSYHSSSRAPQ